MQGDQAFYTKQEQPGKKLFTYFAGLHNSEKPSMVRYYKRA